MNNNTFILNKDSTGQSINVFICDSTNADSNAVNQVGRIGLIHSGVNVTYCLPQEDDVTVTMVTQTPSGAYTSGGFVQIDGTNMPGYYRFDIPDACFSTSNRFCTFLFHAGSALFTPTPAVVNIHHTSDIRGADIQKIKASAQNAIDFDSVIASGSSLAFNSNLTLIRGSSDDADAFHDIVTASSSFAIQADIRMIHGSSDAANNAQKYFGLMQIGAINDASPTATSFVSTVTSSELDRYLGQTVAFTTGSLVGQAREVTAHTTNLGLQMSSAYNQAPVNGDSFIVLPTVTAVTVAGDSNVNVNKIHGSSDAAKKILDILDISSSLGIASDVRLWRLSPPNSLTSGRLPVNIQVIDDSVDKLHKFGEILGQSSTLALQSNPWDSPTTDHNTTATYGGLLGNFSPGSSDSLYQHVSRRGTAL